MSYRYILAYSMTLALAGCGGGETILPAADIQPKAGEPLFVTTKVDGKEVIKETYKYYAVNDSGRLVAEPKPEYENAPHIALLESRQITPMSVVNIHAMSVQASHSNPVNGVEMRVFIEDILYALRMYYPKLSMTDLLRQLVDYDQAFEALLDDYKKSGFSNVAQYVDFYEAIDLGGENDEAEADRFILLNDITTAEFIAKINTQGVSWPALLERMKNQNIKFPRLYVLYVASHKPIEIFIRDFVHHQNSPTTTQNTSSRNVPFDDATEAMIRAVYLGIWIEKFYWDFIKDSKPSDIFSSVLSPSSIAYTRYMNGSTQVGASPSIEFEATRPNGSRIFYTKFQLTGHYKATLSGVPGQWIPIFSFNAHEISTDSAWHINANAVITSVDFRDYPPEPEIKIITNLKASNDIQIFSKSHTFYANGAKGFRVE